MFTTKKNDSQAGGRRKSLASHALTGAATKELAG
jgi:hypothetical protein